MYFIIDSHEGKKIGERSVHNFVVAVRRARDYAKKNNTICEVENEYGVRLFIHYLDGTEKFFI